MARDSRTDSHRPVDRPAAEPAAPACPARAHLATTRRLDVYRQLLADWGVWCAPEDQRLLDSLGGDPAYHDAVSARALMLKAVAQAVTVMARRDIAAGTPL